MSDDENEDIHETAIKQMKKVLEEDSNDQSEKNEEESSSEDDDVIKMDFSKPAEVKQSKQKEQGITALKFMKRSEEKQKEQLKAETQFEIEQIQEQKSGFVNTANKFINKLQIKDLITSEQQTISESKVMEAARRVTG